MKIATGHADETPAVNLPTGPLVLGVDPGLRNYGFAVLELRAEGPWLFDCGCITTTKRKGEKWDDGFLRSTRELAEALSNLATGLGGQLVAVVTEAYSRPPHSTSAAMVGAAWALTVAMLGHVPIVQASPQQVRKSLLGKGNGAKAEVHEVVRERHLSRLAELADCLPRGRMEHPLDAIAAFEASKGHEVIRTAKRLLVTAPTLQRKAPDRK